MTTDDYDNETWRFKTASKS